MNQHSLTPTYLLQLGIKIRTQIVKSCRLSSQKAGTQSGGNSWEKCLNASRASGPCRSLTFYYSFPTWLLERIPLLLGFFQGPSLVGPPSHKLPIPFPYFKGSLWEWYRSSMGMGVPLLGVPGISLDYLTSSKKNNESPSNYFNRPLQKPSKRKNIHMVKF